MCISTITGAWDELGGMSGARWAERIPVSSIDPCGVSASHWPHWAEWVLVGCWNPAVLSTYWWTELGLMC